MILGTIENNVKTFRNLYNKKMMYVCMFVSFIPIYFEPN
jgi:hypothetical protein